jgi:hypothetical protein
MHNELFYHSGTSVALGSGWDVMQVVFKNEGHVINHFTIARNASRTIMHKTDMAFERWEIISNKEDLRVFQKHFDNRDKLAVQKAASAEAGA